MRKMNMLRASGASREGGRLCFMSEKNIIFRYHDILVSMPWGPPVTPCSYAQIKMVCFVLWCCSPSAAQSSFRAQPWYAHVYVNASYRFVRPFVGSRIVRSAAVSSQSLSALRTAPYYTHVSLLSLLSASYLFPSISPSLSPSPFPSPSPLPSSSPNDLQQCTYRFVRCLYSTRWPQLRHRIGSPRFSGTSLSQSPHL
jgi:hypothetical protein